MKRRLTLRRETLSELQSDELGAVVGAISAPNLLCALLTIRYSQCETCGIACTYQCTETS
jgi:hypothetical protein